MCIRKNLIKVGMIFCLLIVGCGKKNENSNERLESKTTEKQYTVSSETESIIQTSQPTKENCVLGSWYYVSCCVTEEIIFHEDGTAVSIYDNSNWKKEYTYAWRWNETNGTVVITEEDGDEKIFCISEDGQSLKAFEEYSGGDLLGNELWSSLDLATKNENDEYYIEGITPYAEDLAGILYRRYIGEEHTIIFDKTGKALVRLDGGSVEWSSGYIYYSTAYEEKSESGSVDYTLYRRLYILDKEGNLLSYHIASKDHIIKAYGDGYVIIEDYTGGFDDSTYHYYVYDAAGNCLGEVAQTQDYPIKTVEYLGYGIFKWRDTYYCPKTGWSMEPDHAIFDDGALIYEEYDYDEYSGEKYDRRVNLFDFNEAGEEKELINTSKGLADFDVYDVEGDVCLLYDGEQVATYNIMSEEMQILNNEYAEKLAHKNLKMSIDSGEFKICGGQIALYLKGRNGHVYNTLFDTNWNVLVEPGGFTKNEKNMIICGNKIYNKKLELVYQYSEEDIINKYYNDGILLLASKDIQEHYMSNSGKRIEQKSENGLDKFVYLDESGQKLFDEINYSDMKCIADSTLPQE